MKRRAKLLSAAEVLAASSLELMGIQAAAITTRPRYIDAHISFVRTQWLSHGLEEKAPSPLSADDILIMQLRQ